MPVRPRVTVNRSGPPSDRERNGHAAEAAPLVGRPTLPSKREVRVLSGGGTLYVVSAVRP